MSFETADKALIQYYMFTYLISQRFAFVWTDRNTFNNFVINANFIYKYNKMKTNKNHIISMKPNNNPIRRLEI